MKKQTLAIVLCIGLMSILLPQAVLAAEAYTYIDQNGESRTTDGLTVTPVTVDTATMSSGWYVVDRDVTRSGTITASGNVYLILTDGFTLTVTGSADNAGIKVLPGNSLTIYGQAAGTGTLSARGGINGAGIGSGKYTTSGAPCGTININGGTINATGGSSGAGIGGGSRGAGGTITVNGGTINATGGTDSAGIGGGNNTITNMNYSSGGTITITGGSVTANGNGRGAGIGGGGIGSSGTISISGGTVNATSGDVSAASGPAGIGGGSYRGVTKITISGGTIIASALDRGAGIGGGSSGSGGIIEISDGSVTASSNSHGAGIGGGEGASGGSITISGGTINASSGYGGSGIGGGYSGTGGSINITDGNITATGGLLGAGIGSGGGNAAGMITITGGVIQANGGEYAAGIGAGGNTYPSVHTGGTIEILGGRVTAKAGTADSLYGFDIGRGWNGRNGTLLLDAAAQVTLATNGIDSSSTTKETCIILGTAAGSLFGAYEDGVKMTGTLINLGNSTLASGPGYTVSGGTVTLTGNGSSYVLFGETTNRRIVVSSGITVNATLFDSEIHTASGSAFNMTGATVNMRLVEGNSLSSGADFAGIQAPTGSSLTINGFGSLSVTGGNNGAGIGGGSSVSGGNITINEGTITALGGSSSAGIGGGQRGAGGNITINGGTVEAGGGGWFNTLPGGSGIGGGVYGSSGVIIIRGGIVTARGGGDGAGIGGDSGDSITIIGGTVTAQGGSGGAGIGGSWKGYIDEVLISGGTVTAQGGNNGAGIGGGEQRSSGNVTINGGTVTAHGGSNGAGIGGGGIGGAGGIVLATGSGTVVSVSGGVNGYDVGSGSGSSAGGSLTVNNDAIVNLNRNGTNATTAYITCTISGGGAGLTAGTYLDSLKLLSFGTVNISPDAGSDAFSAVTLSLEMEELSDALPEGYVSFLANGTEIGQSLITRTEAGSSTGMAGVNWTPSGGTYMLAALYVPDESSNSYYTTGGIQLAESYLVSKIEQTALSISDPGTVTYGDAAFDLLVSGGSGTGSLSYEVTSGEAVSIDSSGQVTPLIAGTATITVTRSGDVNYEPVSATIDITVHKAVPAEIIYPTSGSITYGATLSSSTLSGGSGDGSFAWETPDMIPTVDNSGYTVIFTPRDTDNYDYTGFALESVISVSVSKATPATIFPSAQTITYESALSDSALTGGSGDGSFAWEAPDTVPTVINSGYNVIFTPSDTVNYLTVEQVVSIVVNKADQSPLSISDPGTVTFGDADFDLLVSGGSGTGTLSYE
ncbi:MAG: hypothetical protein JW780_07025, partial [Clostridiales bacterium]|nr:hypothetical protein [Clostridiales bacterium]